MSDMQPAVVIVLPDKQLFTVGEIPKLLAAAKWPHKEGRRVSYVTLHPHGSVRGHMPDLTELESLHILWAAQKLPPPVFPMPEGEWQRYADALEQSKEKLEWSVVPCWVSDAMNQAIVRVAAEEEFRKRLQVSISEAQITVRDPVTNMAVNGHAAQSGNDQLLVSRDDLSRFAREAMLEVQDGRAEPATSVAVSSVDAGPLRTKTPAVAKQSRDAVGREIDDAIARIQNSDTHAIIDQHSVMAELVKRAGLPGSSITECVDRGLGVIWKDTVGKDQKLNKEALRKRLTRRS